MLVSFFYLMMFLKYSLSLHFLAKIANTSAISMVWRLSMILLFWEAFRGSIHGLFATILSWVTVKIHIYRPTKHTFSFVSHSDPKDYFEIDVSFHYCAWPSSKEATMHVYTCSVSPHSANSIELWHLVTEPSHEKPSPKKLSFWLQVLRYCCDF